MARDAADVGKEVILDCVWLAREGTWPAGLPRLSSLTAPLGDWQAEMQIVLSGGSLIAMELA